jgi:hypothetical protein
MRPGRPLFPPTVRFEAAIACAATLCAAAALAHPQADAARGSAPVEPARHHRLIHTQPATGGLVVGIDPETGMLVMPEPEALARLIARRDAAARTARPAPVHHADGSTSLDVRSWMREFARVSVAADGRISVRCVSGPAAAQQVAHEAPAPAQEER